MKKTFLLIMIITVLSLACNVWQYHLYSSVKKSSDTVTSVQYVSYKEPVATKTDTIRQIIAKLRLDTCYVVDSIHDSVRVIVPITQKIYKDTSYTAYVSGYNANLDSLNVAVKTVTVTNTITKTKRFGIGIQGGIGYTPKGFQPYIGVGVHVNLFGF